MLENNKVFVQLYTKFYDSKMCTAAQSCVVISHVHTYMLLYKQFTPTCPFKYAAM